MTLTKTQAAYIAAILDGEGMITIRRSVRAPSTLMHSPNANASYGVVVVVSNTAEPLISWLRTTTKMGYVFCTNYKPTMHKPIHVWRLRNHETLSIIPQVLPYLIIKRRQAEIALAFCDKPDFRRRRGHKGRGIPTLPPAEVARREALYRESRQLNKRGI